MTPGRDLADGLAAVASRYTPDARKAKLELLARLETARVGQAAAFLRLHEALCFLQAYPDDAEVLARVDRALAAFPARVTRLGAPARRRLHDAGVAGATLDYPFAFPMARWLARRFPRDAEVAWGRFEEVDRLDETLSLLASPAEGDAFSEGGMGWRRWLRVAKGGRRMTDLALLLELFERARLPTETRDWLWENLRLPILWTPRGPGASRTLARLPPARVFFHADGLRRPAAPLTRALAGPLPVLRPAPRALAETLIDAARVAMATRQRELHAFSYPNPDDVLVMDGDRGLRLAFFGIAPGFRLPLESYYAFLALKNGTIVVDRYQLGHESTEALRSGSFYFYHRLGFRPRDPAVLRVLAGEEASLAADRSYRSPVPVLKRLAGGEVYLTLPGADPEPEHRLRATDVAGLVAGLVAREFGGDRVAAARESAARARRVLGVGRARGWSREERRAFEQLSLVAALIPALARWPAADKRALAALMRAKGGPSELAYARRLDRHRRLRLRLEARARG